MNPNPPISPACPAHAALKADIASCIDQTIEAIADRLKAKGPVYEADAEWTLLADIASQLRRAKRELLELAP